MKFDLLLANIMNFLLFGFILQMVLSAVFSITAIKMNANRLPVKTSIEAVTFIISLFLCYILEPLRIFKNSGLVIQPAVDFIISAFFLVSVVELFKGISSRLKGE